MILFVAFAFILCTCESRRNDLQRLNTNQHQLKQRTLAKTTRDLDSCDEGWVNLNGHCYLVVNEGRPWNEASAYCENMASSLIEITTDSEFDAVAELMRDYSGYTWYWIGATDTEVEGGETDTEVEDGATDRDTERTFIYQHSRQRIPEKYWKYGQPDDTEQHCALMHSWSNGDLKFYDGRCEWNWFFVCEKP